MCVCLATSSWLSFLSDSAVKNLPASAGDVGSIPGLGRSPAEGNGFSSVAQSYPTLCDTMDCSTPGFPVHHQLPELTLTHVYQVSLVMPSNHLILCHPLLLLPSIFPSIRVFSNELFASGGQSIGIRWPKKWLPTPVFLAGKSHGQKSLAGYSPWGGKELATAEQLNNNS